MIIGAIYHEYSHINTVCPKNYSIVVYADSSGYASGDTALLSHDYIYFNNTMLESFLMLFSIACLLMIFLKDE
jgi:hypothetical protein